MVTNLHEDSALRCSSSALCFGLAEIFLLQEKLNGKNEKQMLIERTYVTIEEQLKSFERKFLLGSKMDDDSLRQSFERIETQWNSMEKFHSHLLFFASPSSIDTTSIERSQRFESSMEKKFDEVFRFDFLSNQIDVDDQEQKSETFARRAQMRFLTFRSRCIEMIEKIRDDETKLKTKHSFLNDRFGRFIFSLLSSSLAFRPFPLLIVRRRHDEQTFVRSRKSMRTPADASQRSTANDRRSPTRRERSRTKNRSFSPQRFDRRKTFSRTRFDGGNRNEVDGEMDNVFRSDLAKTMFDDQRTNRWNPSPIDYKFMSSACFNSCRAEHLHFADQTTIQKLSDGLANVAVRKRTFGKRIRRHRIEIENHQPENRRTIDRWKTFTDRKKT